MQAPGLAFLSLCQAGSHWEAGYGDRSPPDTQQWSGFMDLDITHGAVFVGLQVAHDAGFADLE